jgi:quinoprotein glucose dehydrogenase
MAKVTSASFSPGYQLVELNAKTGLPIPAFGENGKIDLTEGLDRPVVKPGQIGASSPAIVVRDTVVVGAALLAGTAPRSKENVPGYIRGFDVRTGKRLWTFHTIPRPGEFGNDTWEDDSWKYTGNTGAWAPLSADEELGYVYIPVEMPTGDSTVETGTETICFQIVSSVSMRAPGNGSGITSLFITISGTGTSLRRRSL